MIKQDISPYQRLGGEAGVRRLVDRFYDLMDTLPEAAHIRAMHPASLATSRDKLFKFLCGWLGYIWKNTVTHVCAPGTCHSGSMMPPVTHGCYV